MKRDLELTIKDQERCAIIAENIDLFIRECGDEDRSECRMDAIKYATYEALAKLVRERIERAIAESSK